jgi:hypothetical protein
MNLIPQFPNFIDFDNKVAESATSFLYSFSEGVSEFSPISLFLDQPLMQYKISQISDKTVVFSGIESGMYLPSMKGKSFFSIVGDVPFEYIPDLFKLFDFWKSVTENQKISLIEKGLESVYRLEEDRNNSEYVYSREKLATLSGKSLHKKRNLVNNFESTYNPCVLPLDRSTCEDGLKVLEQWQMEKPSEERTDYLNCKLALQSFCSQEYNWMSSVLSGKVIYVAGVPVGFSIGEYIQQGKMYTVHFEKAVDAYKGVYQFVNKTTVAALPETVELINREQDLGDEGLRQAKMTYRPLDFINKYIVYKV